MISKFFKQKKNSYYITFLTIIKKNQINLTVLRFFFQIRASSTVHSIQCFMDDEKQPTRKQSIVRGSLGYHPTIRYPIFTKCRRMFAHVYRNAPLLYRPPGPHPGKPTSPHTPIHMHRHPEHTLAFCSTLFPCSFESIFLPKQNSSLPSSLYRTPEQKERYD